MKMDGERQAWAEKWFYINKMYFKHKNIYHCTRMARGWGGVEVEHDWFGIGKK